MDVSRERKPSISSKDWHCTKGDIFFLLLFIKVPRTSSWAHSLKHTRSDTEFVKERCEAMRKKHVLVHPKSLLKISTRSPFLTPYTPQPNLRLSSIYIIIFLFKSPFPSLFSSVDSMLSESCYSTGNSVLLDYLLYMNLFVRGCSFCSSLFVPGMFISLISSETTIVLQLHNNNAPKYRTCLSPTNEYIGLLEVCGSRYDFVHRGSSNIAFCPFFLFFLVDHVVLPETGGTSR